MRHIWDTWLPAAWRPGDQGLRRLARQVDGALAAAAQLLSAGVAAAVRVVCFQLGDVAGLAHAPCWLPASGLQVCDPYTLDGHYTVSGTAFRALAQC
jgi:hypothetical protein